MNIFQKTFFSIRRFFGVVSDSFRIDHHRGNVSYWQKNSIYVDNIFNKISTDVAMMKFKHITMSNVDGLDVVTEMSDSDLSYVLNTSPNDFETPLVFWSNVVRNILQNQICVVVPKMSRGNIESLSIVDFKGYEEHKVVVDIDGEEKKLDVGSVWIFENPKQNISNQLGHITRLIDDNLKALSFKVSEQGQSLKGFLKLPNSAADDMLKAKAQKRVEAISDVSNYNGIGYLEKGEEFIELKNQYSTASEQELEFLKMQIYQAYGINEKLFTCDYTEEQYRAYYSSVLKVYKRLIDEEINRKYFTKASRTRGHKLLCYFDMFDITSLKDLSEFCFKQKYSGTMNSNEVRAFITTYGGYPLSAYEGGDIYETNKNAVQVQDIVSGDNNQE